VKQENMGVTRFWDLPNEEKDVKEIFLWYGIFMHGNYKEMRCYGDRNNISS
jgi:hypothetical protein